MGKYPPYHCDVLALEALSLQKRIGELERDLIAIPVQIVELKEKKQDIVDYLHSQGLPLQVL